MSDIAATKSIEIWFQDEARIGQKNGIVRLWARKGTRPRQPADQRYQSAYLFGAVCPARGTGAALMMPKANTFAMQAHLDEISLHIAATQGEVEADLQSGVYRWRQSGGAWQSKTAAASMPACGFEGMRDIHYSDRFWGDVDVAIDDPG